MQSEISLSDWITQVGPANIAKKLKINVTSVCQWQDYHCLPRPEMMLKIQSLSKEQVSCNGMVREFVNSKKKATRKSKGN